LFLFPLLYIPSKLVQALKSENAEIRGPLTEELTKDKKHKYDGIEKCIQDVVQFIIMIITIIIMIMIIMYILYMLEANDVLIKV